MKILPGCLEGQSTNMATSVRTVTSEYKIMCLNFFGTFHAFRLITFLDEYGYNMIYKIIFLNIL